MHSLKGWFLFDPSLEEQGQVHSGLSDTVGSCATLSRSLGCTTVSSRSNVAAVVEAEADLFQIAVQIHGHNHGSQLVGREQGEMRTCDQGT